MTLSSSPLSHSVAQPTQLTSSFSASPSLEQHSSNSKSKSRMSSRSSRVCCLREEERQGGTTRRRRRRRRRRVRAYTGGEEDREWGRERLLYFSPARQAITGPTRLSRLGARARQQPTEALQSRQPERYNHPPPGPPGQGTPSAVHRTVRPLSCHGSYGWVPVSGQGRPV